MKRNRFLKSFFIVNLIGIIFSVITYSQVKAVGKKKTIDPVPILKIGLVADPQYCDCVTEAGRNYREALNRLNEAVDTFNLAKVDFVMNLGDMIEKYKASYDSIFLIYKHLNMPFYNLLGNHEFEKVPGKYLAGILTRYSMPDYYYDFDYKNWRFIVLDGTELAKYSRELHYDLAQEGDSLWQGVLKNHDMPAWNGGISRRQQQWMNDRLSDALKMKMNVIVFCHFPVYPESIEHTLWNYNEIMSILEKYPNVVAYINGHYHEGHYGYKNGIHYITQKAMLENQESNSFSILEIYPTELRIKGFGSIPDKNLNYSDIKNR
jgi:manganese-dependent ADP-ribose/CDP-alcohol diphosphatase